MVHSAYVAQGCNTEVAKGEFVSLQILLGFEQLNPLQMRQSMYITQKNKQERDLVSEVPDCYSALALFLSVLYIKEITW